MKKANSKPTHHQAGFGFNVEVIDNKVPVHKENNTVRRSVTMIPSNIGLAAGNFGDYIKNKRGNKV